MFLPIIEFLKQCRATTDFHFDDVDTQLQQIRQEAQKQPLSIGDVFITRHSNLQYVHVVFHIVVPSNPLVLFGTQSTLLYPSHI